MTITLIVLFFVGCIAFLFRPTKRARRAEPLAKTSFAIEMTPEETASEHKADQEIMTILEVKMVNSGVFKQERVSHLIALLQVKGARLGLLSE